jgi:hypothetical protein
MRYTAGRRGGERMIGTMITTMIDKAIRTFEWLMGEPLVPVMVFIALVCAITALRPTRGVRQRLGIAALAVISAMTAWMMATRWHWPS